MEDANAEFYNWYANITFYATRDFGNKAIELAWNLFASFFIFICFLFDRYPLQDGFRNGKYEDFEQGDVRAGVCLKTIVVVFSFGYIYIVPLIQFTKCERFLLGYEE